MLIHLDAVGGVAGDMFIAAVTDAFPHLREGLLAAVRAAGLPAAITCRFDPHRDHALTGSRFVVDIPGQHEHHDYQPVHHGHAHPHGPHDHAHDHAHPHAGSHRALPHPHRDFAELRAHLLNSALAPEVKQHAVGIFTILAQAEGRVHGVPPDQVSFHELGEWDSIADIVGAAYLIAALSAETWTIGMLPQGSGFVQTAHGRLPVPVPAVADILQGYAFIDDGLAGERITPTGAAIVKHLGCRQQREDRRARVLRQSGYGFGTRTFPGLSNVLRVTAFEMAELGGEGESTEAALVEFEVDDQTPEDLAIGLDRIRTRPGVLDVLQMPAFGKKGRIAAHIQVIAEPGALQDVIDACFLETTTIGLRHHAVHRQRLPRDLRVVQVGNHAIRVKIAHRPSAITAKAESDDTQVLAGSDQRAQLRRSAEAASLDRQPEEDPE